MDVAFYEGDDTISDRLLDIVANIVYHDNLRSLAVKQLGFTEAQYQLTVDKNDSYQQQNYQVLVKWRNSTRDASNVKYLLDQIVHWKSDGYLDESVWDVLGKYVNPDTILDCTGVVAAPPRLFEGDDKIDNKLLVTLSVHINPSRFRTLALEDMDITEEQYIDMVDKYDLNIVQILMFWRDSISARSGFYDVRFFLDRVAKWQREGHVDGRVWEQLGRLVAPEALLEYHPKLSLTNQGQLTQEQDAQKRPVDNYRINTSNILGKGTFGIVYSARDLGDGKTVAVKVINNKDHPTVVEKASELYQNLREQHANVVTVYDSFTHDDNLHIIMKYCEHGDLNQYFRTSEWVPLTSRVDIMLQIAKGVEFLHTNNIIHRDMKPANVLVAAVLAGEAPQVQLTDFDLSKWIDPEYETSVMTTDVGTARFKAPDFWRVTAEGKREYHKDVDIYGTGLMFLAIVQEISKRDGKLLPCLETFTEVSEIHNPIGGTIYERLKMKKKFPSLDLNLEVIILQNEDGENLNAIKKLVAKMAKAEPKDRMPASEVVDKLECIKESMVCSQ